MTRGNTAVDLRDGVRDHRTRRSELSVDQPLADDPRHLTPEQREAWHRAQEDLERAWLDAHIRALRPYITAA